MEEIRAFPGVDMQMTWFCSSNIKPTFKMLPICLTNYSNALVLKSMNLKPKLWFWITWSLKSIITLRNTLINNVENFKYLGAFIKHDQPSTGDVELNYCIQITLSKFVEMSSLLQNVKMNLRTRVSFFNSFIRSRLVYSCQN